MKLILNIDPSFKECVEDGYAWALSTYGIKEHRKEIQVLFRNCYLAAIQGQYTVEICNGFTVDEFMEMWDADMLKLYVKAMLRQYRTDQHYLDELIEDLESHVQYENRLGTIFASYFCSDDYVETDTTKGYIKDISNGNEDDIVLALCYAMSAIIIDTMSTHYQDNTKAIDAMHRRIKRPIINVDINYSALVLEVTV